MRQKQRVGEYERKEKTMSGGFASISFLLVEINAFSDRYEEFEKLNTQILRVSIDIVLSLFSSDDFFTFSFFWKIFINKLISNLVFSWGEALLNKIPIKWNIFEHLTKSIAQSFGVLIPGQLPYFYTGFLDSVDCLPVLCSHHFF